MKNLQLLLKSIIVLSLLGFYSCAEKKQEKTSRTDILPFYNEATFTPNWFESSSDVPTDFHKIPAFSLTNQNNETITEESLNGKITIADFFFTTCPGICPKMTKNLKIIQDEFLKDEEILILSHSVTPIKDSVPVLKRHAEGKEIVSGKWHLLTGDRKQIYDLGRQAYFAEEDLGLTKKESDFLHTENFLLIDKNRRVRGIYSGLNKTAIQQLIADIKTLKKEG